MATRTKTIKYAHPPLAAMTNNTLTTMTQITVYIPETVVNFQSVVATVNSMQTATATGNIITRQLQCRLGAAGYTAHTNSNLYTGSAEDFFIEHVVDLTSHFTTNWTGTSMTFDSQVLLNGDATAAAWTNTCVEVYITYQYDDTAATQIKTVYIPLDMPVGALATSKPGAALATIPDLADELPEASKTFRNSYITVQGNVGRAGAIDITMTFQLDATASHTTGVYEGVSATDHFYRYIWDAPTLDTTISMGWYAWGSAADFNHSQAWLTVTYEFKADVTTTTTTEDLDASETGVDVTAAANLGTAPYSIQIDNEVMLVTSVTSNTLTVTRGYEGSTAATHSNGATVSSRGFVSTMIPLTMATPMGENTTSDYQRGSTEYWIEEPTKITTKQLAFFTFWDAVAPISTLQFRIGTGSFVTYSDAAAVIAGSNAAMVRLDSAFTLARGKNTLNFDSYTTDTSDYGTNVSGFWIANYTAGKPTGGYGAQNHTIFFNLGATYDGSSTPFRELAAVAPAIAESSYFFNSLGINYRYFTNSTNNVGGISITAERLASGEGGLIWEGVFCDTPQSDPETGVHLVYAENKSLFKRFPSDADSTRLDVETARRWRMYLASTGASSFHYMDMMITFHAVTSTVSGTISNSNGGSVSIGLHRDDTGERLLETSRSGNGTYSFTWYDNTVNMFVEAYESNTYKGRSGTGTATIV